MPKGSRSQIDVADVYKDSLECDICENRIFIAIRYTYGNRIVIAIGYTYDNGMFMIMGYL